MIYFSSDLHFNHNKDFIFADRGFSCVEEMNKTIITNWNNIITEKDEIYLLGDVFLGDIESGLLLLKQLKGQIHLIIGNHDTDERIKRIKELSNIKTIDYAYRLKYKKNLFWLSHYPTCTNNLDDDKPWVKTVINLFGHTHQKQPFYNNNPYIYNVGVDAHNCEPVSIEQILKDIKEKREEVTKK